MYVMTPEDGKVVSRTEGLGLNAYYETLERVKL